VDKLGGLSIIIPSLLIRTTPKGQSEKNKRKEKKREDVWSLGVAEPILYYEKKKQILDSFKPSRNAKKPYGINSRWFFLDGLKQSRI
jgi:hypothetical protein